MKKINLLHVVILLLCLMIIPKVYSQTDKLIETNITIVIKNTVTEETFDLVNGYGVQIETSSGNILRMITFKFDDTHPIMDFEGQKLPIALSIYAKYENGDDVLDDNGDRILIYRDAHSVLTKNGKLKFIFHINGAGVRLPRGW